MVAIRTSLSADTNAPAEVKALADELIAFLNNHARAIIGPALSMVFAFTILELGGCAEDMAKLSEILRDISTLVTKYGAASVRHTH